MRDIHYSSTGNDTLPSALQPTSTLHLWLYQSQSIASGQVLRVDTIHIGRLYTIGVEKVYLGKEKDTILFWEPGAPPYYVVGANPPLDGERVFMAGRLFPYRMHTHLKEARASLFMGYFPFPYPADYELVGFCRVIEDSIVWGTTEKFNFEKADSLLIAKKERKL